MEVVDALDRFSGGVRIGVRLTAGEGPYTLDLQYYDLPDPRPLDISVAPEPAPPERTRLVTVTLGNNGGPADNTDLRVWASYATNDHRIVDRTTLSIPANGTISVAFPWDTTGQAGDATIIACVESAVDATNRNNRADHRTSVLTPLPVGVDANSVPDYVLKPYGPWFGYCYTWDDWTYL